VEGAAAEAATSIPTSANDKAAIIMVRKNTAQELLTKAAVQTWKTRWATNKDRTEDGILCLGIGFRIYGWMSVVI
jgi:hypothetical protein